MWKIDILLDTHTKKNQYFHLFIPGFRRSSLLFSDLPDVAFHTWPYGDFSSLCGLNIAPVQLGVGDIVQGLWVGTRTVFRTCHHNGQRALVWIVLHNMELLPVSQLLKRFLQGGEDVALRRKIWDCSYDLLYLMVDKEIYTRSRKQYFRFITY